MKDWEVEVKGKEVGEMEMLLEEMDWDLKEMELLNDKRQHMLLLTSGLNCLTNNFQ